MNPYLIPAYRQPEVFIQVKNAKHIKKLQSNDAYTVLNKVAQYFFNKDLVQGVLKERNFPVTLEGLISAMASPIRNREIVIPRQAFCYFYRSMSTGKVTLKSIGKYLGKRDHSTVIHAVQTWADLLETDKVTQQYHRDLEQILNYEC